MTSWHAKPPVCRNCGKEIANKGQPSMGGNHEILWMHVPGGTVCDPQQGADSQRAEPAVQAGEIWYSMMGDANYLVLKDGQLGAYAIEVEEYPTSGQWHPVPGESRGWLTIQQLTQYGALVGHQEPTV
ncbi:hypothetical protein [Streptomyces sp. NPDC050416]|uniref:hypothetical protein n=1 Tax=Streptomyces sp. NPDC050416 TaxID=3365611 RepID=UPI0037A77EEA